MRPRAGRRPAAGVAQPVPRDAWHVALKQIAMRARSSHEVRQNLARRGYAPDEIASVIARLITARYLDDADFARSWVSTRAQRGVAAPARLARELRRKGIGAGDIAAALRDLQGEWDAVRAAGEAARRKLKALTGLPPPVVRRRLAAFLERRGFDPDVVQRTCRQYVTDAMDTE